MIKEVNNNFKILLLFSINLYLIKYSIIKLVMLLIIEDEKNLADLLKDSKNKAVNKVKEAMLSSNGQSIARNAGYIEIN